MKKLKYLFLTLLSTFVLTGCGNNSTPTPTPEPQIVEVESIITSEPVITITVDEVYMLRYSILPANASNKYITVNTKYSNYTVSVTIDDANNVLVQGIHPGTGVINITSKSNSSAFVSYSITVIPKEEPEPPEPVIYEAVDIANAFNAAAKKYGFQVEYNLVHGGWIHEHDFGPNTDESRESLKPAVDFFKPFFPDFVLRFSERYTESTGSVPTEYRLILVNSNISAIAEIYSCIDNGHLWTYIFIYDAI